LSVGTNLETVFPLKLSRRQAQEGYNGMVLIRATQNMEEFAAAPIGRCIIGANFVIWCAAPDLQGTIVWGTLDERSVREMMQVGQFIRHPDIAPRRRAIADCRDLERIDGDVVLAFTAMARERLGAWTAGMERQALIVPEGLEGILLAGALPSVGVAYPLRIAHDLANALAFVDHPAAAAAHAAASEIASEMRGHSALLSRLRAVLGRGLVSPTIDVVATALGMSTRTLQRELRRLDTSFSDELRRVRIAAAEALLVLTDLKIDAIATQVGFGTASRMSASLRRERNLTASELRARRGLS
jgi:AraC-like DNA-binding protein